MSTTMFTEMCEYLLHKLDRNQVLNKSKYMEELPKIMKKYYYKGKVDKSWLITGNIHHILKIMLYLYNIIQNIY